MANINDFKLLNLKCNKYFNLLEKSVEFENIVTDEKQKCRMGFYIFLLESICGIKDISEICDLISDTDFNKIIYGVTHDDFGVDAVHIDDDKKQISLFNFKYRNSFSGGGKQKLNETLLSSKYTNAIANEDLTGLVGKTKESARNVIKKLNSNDIWSFCLYVVSNEDVEISNNDAHIKQLEKAYELQVIPIGLPYISEMLSIRPEPINATFMIEPEALMSYREHSLSSSTSYIARLSGSEIVRITCSNSTLRNQYNIEDLSPLSSEKLNFGVLFDNVRGFVLKSKYNGNIIKSLKDDPSKFFMYNNGITIVAKKVNNRIVNGKKKHVIEIEDYQILNGGQTVRSIHNFNSSSDDNISEYLTKSEVLVRIFVLEQPEAINKIAEYTNSQNTISLADLKSLSSEQIEIEQFLDEHNIIYSRKTGDTGISERDDYEYKISMERFGQLLLALRGEPEKSSNHKQHIFGKYYDGLFGRDIFNLNEAPEIVRFYYNIIVKYQKVKIKYSPLEQKYYYILHMNVIRPDIDIMTLIDILESNIKSFNVAKETSDARKMIQVGFREKLDEFITNYTVNK